MKQRILIVNSGGDCPGMNAVIRAIVRRAEMNPEYEILGSVNGFDGILSEPLELIRLNPKVTQGIIRKGGTFLTTNTQRSPFQYPVKQDDGTIKIEDLSDKLIYNLKVHGIEAIIHIGGNTSHIISQKLFEKGVNIIGIPKTINNDLSVTDYTFGFQTATQVATDAVDKLVTTANSHNRVLILEVMGRNAGWIALSAAIAGGADVCLIPEIPFTFDSVMAKLKSRYSSDGRGFANIVVAEGACPKGEKCEIHSGAIARRITYELKTRGFEADIRETILGHLQRGGIPNAFDRILATELGVKAFDLITQRKFGTIAIHKNRELSHIELKKAINQYNAVDLEHNLIHTARGIGISFGD
ncbi:MAG: ATP-dependent 6-phosphofructokinase [Salinivirgaceae bacterium]|nr:ATP-dependent 6-phosphofructokinase [Salinivirgaceae bacterium]